MRNRIYILLLTLTAVIVGGCGSMTSIYRSRSVNDDKIIAIDAKQRFAVIKYQTKERVSGDGKETTAKTIQSFCAEPSPDALSAISASLSGGLTKPSGKSIQAASALAESSSNIGLRTQSIQLLRDGMYRVCEAYLSGAITESEVKRLLSRYQDTMVAILAIEQLTGVTTPRQVTLGGSAAAGVGDEVNEALEALNQARENEKKAKTHLDELNNPERNPPATEPEKEEAQQKVKDAQDAVKVQEDAFAAAKARVKTYAASGGKAYQISTTVKLSDAAAQHISKAVTNIVDSTMLTNEFVATCLDFFDARNDLTKAVARDELQKTNQPELSTLQQTRAAALDAIKQDPLVGSCNALIKAYVNRLQ